MQNGASIVIKGELIASEDLVFAGRIEGRIRLESGLLTLAAGSQVVGEVEVPTVIVNGAIEGKVAASERVELRTTAVVKGDVSAPRLVLTEGALVNGRIEMPALPVAPAKLAIAS